MKTNKWITLTLAFALACIALTVRAQTTEPPIDSAQYARIYVYRPFFVFSSLIGFGLRKDGVKVAKLRNNSGREIKVYRPDIIAISTKSIERQSSVQLNVELGKKYFIRCKPRLSYLTVNPKLQLVDAESGEREYKDIVKEN
ncbi:hypothetical protein [Spirosoma montaniterrae]|uniref:DUF2846 domain-containing protein n=1 Tax=Spirosoma montaniterrae TaxID=1178516 RepID=A0A1P9WSD0_9BACT|nr:hypothetical protein [Spirosoma montaniterrae]AQG78269.1 hypothetical protein AWR27_02275 [Spirosoma montaniterrae]